MHLKSTEIEKSKAYKDEIIRAVEDAVDVGYRHIDGAFFYANEVEVGKAIRQKMEEKVVERKDLFIVSKVLFKLFQLLFGNI